MSLQTASFPTNIIDNVMNSTIASAQEVELLRLIGDTIEQWQIHRIHCTYGLISQHEPMKLIYHYEQLSDELKQQHPLNGKLLRDFDRLMNRADFAKLVGINEQRVAQPWQLKFVGKLVIFHNHPEIAMRLQWTNTLKNFEPIYPLTSAADNTLEAAIERSFSQWQFIDSVEIVNKNPNIVLTVSDITLDNYEQHWQLASSPQFEVLPAQIASSIGDFLHDQAFVREHWLPQLKLAAIDYAQKLGEID